MKTSKDIKIWHYVLCYNEIQIMPHIIEYWKLYADKVIVYDNESTDGSPEYLKQFDWIEVRTFNSKNEFNNLYHIDIKNNAWKEAKENNVDFVIVSDFDEVLYTSKNIKEILYNNIQNDVWNSQWCNMVIDKFPLLEKGMLMHKHPLMKMNITHGDKFLLFNVKTIESVKYTAGAHSAQFEKYDKSSVNFFKNDDIYLLHFHDIGIEYIQERNKRFCKRLSQVNLQRGWGIHYHFSDEKVKNDIYIAYNKGIFSHDI